MGFMVDPITTISARTEGRLNAGGASVDMRAALPRQLPTSRSAPQANAIPKRTFMLLCKHCRKNTLLPLRSGNYYAIDQNTLYRWICHAVADSCREGTRDKHL